MCGHMRPPPGENECTVGKEGMCFGAWSQEKVALGYLGWEDVWRKLLDWMRNISNVVYYLFLSKWIGRCSRNLDRAGAKMKIPGKNGIDGEQTVTWGNRFMFEVYRGIKKGPHRTQTRTCEKTCVCACKHARIHTHTQI